VKWAKNARAKADRAVMSAANSASATCAQPGYAHQCRLQAAGINYSRLTSGLLKAQVAVDRKILSEFATHNPEIFLQFVEIAKAEVEDVREKVKKSRRRYVIPPQSEAHGEAEAPGLKSPGIRTRGKIIKLK